jgi:trigger factor
VKVLQEMTAPRQAVLTIELEPHEVEPYLERASRRLAHSVHIPGFRPGKAPRHLVERMVGKEALLGAALDLLASDVTAKVAREHNLPLGGAPRVEVISRAPVTLKATVPLAPRVELNNYRALRIPQDPVQVEEEDVQRLLEDLRRERATWEPVERPARVGDMVVIALTGTVEGQRVFQEGAMPFYIGEGSHPLGPEFGEHLAGAQVGEVREFTLPIPETHPSPELRGKPCAYRVLVKEVRTPFLPPLDDAFARAVDPSVEGLEALKARLRERLRHEAERLQQERYHRRALEALRRQATVEVPPLLIEREVERTLEDLEKGLAARGQTMEQWLAASGKTLQEVREELLPEAERKVVERYLLERLAEEEGIRVTPEEIEAEARSLMPQGEGQKAARVLQDPVGRQALARLITRRKALRRLVQIVSQPPEGESEGR